MGRQCYLFIYYFFKKMAACQHAVLFKSYFLTGMKTYLLMYFYVCFVVYEEYIYVLVVYLVRLFMFFELGVFRKSSIGYINLSVILPLSTFHLNGFREV